MSTDVLATSYRMEKSLGYVLGAGLVLAVLFHAGLPLFPFGGLALVALLIGGTLLFLERSPFLGSTGAYVSAALASLGYILAALIH